MKTRAKSLKQERSHITKGWRPTKARGCCKLGRRRPISRTPAPRLHRLTRPAAGTEIAQPAPRASRRDPATGRRLLRQRTSPKIDPPAGHLTQFPLGQGASDREGEGPPRALSALSRKGVVARVEFGHPIHNRFEVLASSQSKQPQSSCVVVVIVGGAPCWLPSTTTLGL
jgi:hypothetical protein